MAAGFAVCAVAIGVIVVAFLWLSNELFPFGRAADASSGNQILWGSAFGQAEFAYKLARARAIKPEILVLGSSTANQFRAEMTPGATFYNAAGGGRNFANARLFLEQLIPLHRPKLVIVTPAWLWLNPKRDVFAGKGVPEEFSYRSMLANALGKLTDPKFLTDILSHDLRTEKDPIGGRRPLGYMAARFGAGYRPDGSYQYGRFLAKSDPYYDLHGYGYRNGFRYFRSYVQTAKGRFKYHGLPREKEIEDVRKLVRTVTAANIDLIFVLTPIVRPVYRDIKKNPEWAAFFQRYFEIVADVSKEYGVEFYNFTEMDDLGVTDAQTIDALHGDETTYLEMMYKIATSSPTLAKHIDVEALAALYEKMQNPDNRPHANLIAR